MYRAELVELWRRCEPSALNFEELITFQALLYISARTVARAGLFMKRQIMYVTSEGCGLKSQGHFQVANIINSDLIGEFFQLQYCYVTLIRCVCVGRYCATDMWFGLHWKQLNTTYGVGQNRKHVSANVKSLRRKLKNRHVTLRGDRQAPNAE